MKLEILETLYCGPDKTYKKGLIVTDNEEPIPEDLKQEIREKSRAVKVLEWGEKKGIEKPVQPPIPQTSTPTSDEGDNQKPEIKRAPRPI